MDMARRKHYSVHGKADITVCVARQTHYSVDDEAKASQSLRQRKSICMARRKHYNGYGNAKALHFV
jgi:hypothetical protein